MGLRRTHELGTETVVISPSQTVGRSPRGELPLLAGAARLLSRQSLGLQLAV